jgi:glycosyltransferase involved in cell wall biosynthesis
MKSQKRLLIVYWNMGLGGIQKRIRDIVIDLSKNYPDWDIYILLRRRSKAGFDDQLQGHDRVYMKYYDVTSPFRIPLGFVFWIGWYYIKVQPTTVLTFQSLLSFVLVLYKYLLFWIRSKLVINDGAVPSQTSEVIQNSNLGMLIRIAYPHADAIIVPTKACKYDLVHNYFVTKDIITIIPNWTLFAPKAPLFPTFDIVFIGRFDPEKNPMFMIRLTNALLSRHSDLHVAMMGYGSMRGALIEMIKQENLQHHIEIMPFSQKVEDLLRHSKILVVPSLNEGMPNVVLEAAMCQAPTVANNFLGSEEVILHNKTGFIYTKENDAIKYIEYLLAHTDSAKRIGKNAQKFAVTRFSYKNQKEFIKLIIS